MRLRRFLISDPMARSNLVDFGHTARKQRSRRSLGRVVDALYSQGLTGATPHRETCRFKRSALAHRGRIDTQDRVAPLIHAHEFRCQFVAVPEAVTEDRIHLQHESVAPTRHSQTNSDSCSISGTATQCFLDVAAAHGTPCAWFSISTAKTVSADSTSRTTPSGWRQAPRPSMT